MMVTLPYTAAVPVPSVNYAYSARLVRTIDGDTALLDVDLGFDVHFAVHIRFAGYNAPEIRGPHSDQGFKAKAELESLLAGKKLVITTTKDFVQTFARYVADVYVLDQAGTTSVANHMISLGYNVPQGQ